MVKRGDIVTAILPGAYGKPRPALVIQANTLEDLGSVIIIPITSTITNMAFRPIIKPNRLNSLDRLSQAMVDKLGAAPLSKIGGFIGELDAATMKEIEQQLLIVFGIG